MAFLAVDDIEVHYGLFKALTGVSIEASEGETLSIIGANGAGKTTLLRAICGARPVSRGAIRLRDKPVQNLAAYTMSALGVTMVPEGRRLFPSLSVEDNLLLGGFSGRIGYWTLNRVYELFPELVKRRSNMGLNLSGGEQQMVAIGRALMGNPSLILLDEVSLGLAPIVVNQIYDALRSIVSQGTTVLLVEQDVARGLEIADRVYCLLEGKVSLQGAPREMTEAQIMRAYFGV